MAGLPSKLIVRHVVGDGWRPDYQASVETQADQNGRIVIPHLLAAENMMFGPNGRIRKMPGLAKLNSVAFESGATVMGLFDWWQLGTGGSSQQRRIVHVGTKVKADTGDGSFSDILTGMTSGAVPSYCVFNDELIMSNDGGDVPQVFDGSSAGALGGTPPAFAFAVSHKDRVWAAGVPGAPSTLYYSALGNHEDWAGAGSGSITVGYSDGDRITGLISHKDVLFVFKGPNRGSIHYVQGSAPTGDDPYKLVPFVRDVGGVAHNAIFYYGDDVGFIDCGGAVRSLAATDKYGSFTVATLSSGLDEYMREVINFSQFRKARAVNVAAQGRVVTTEPINGSSTHNIMRVMDYRYQPPRWTYWVAKGSASLAAMKDPQATGRPTLFMGGYDGFVRKTAATAALDGSTAISMLLRTPFLHYGAPERDKKMTGGAVTVAPKASGNFLFKWSRDSRAQQSATVSQGNGGAALGSFILGTDELGGVRASDRFFEAEEGGEFRAIQYEIQQTTLSQDFEMAGWLARIEVEGENWESV